MTARRGELIAFIHNVIANPQDECILWPFGRQGDGYGAINYKGGTRTAHRVALIISTGKDPKNLGALHGREHACDSRLCVNPDHLYWGTQLQNTADRRRDGTAPNYQGVNHPGNKLTEKQVLSIRSDPRPNTVIARDYGVVHSSIYGIKKGRSWKHLIQQKVIQNE